ncbi:aminopeptidase N [Acidithiobacillus albertensis]|uniref:aminopeptidase N n=1 Tax=Acidithiobacillus albertensis TaxID=119978 RepID=UPI00094B1486|nr:aminopeptidase N [Acidithiobacillus albertensis]
MIAQDNNAVIHREDYQPPLYRITEVALNVHLDPENTEVEACLHFQRLVSEPVAELHLDGESLELLSALQDGQPLAENLFRSDATGLTLLNPEPEFVLETRVRIHPAANLTLSGLYFAGGQFLTQCEAEGFRRITYYLDRPDCLAKFTVTLHASRKTCPVLLANGNCIAQGDEDNNWHWARWEDPYPKPAYLFAMVAGDLAVQRDVFVTQSGRSVTLEIYVAERDLGSCDQAMESLKRAMRWDEEVYGREYDLDRYMIVATDSFNMGAMENKGLNIFNSKYVLASPETATDTDYQGVESVIAHEYFHNWTGNRVTLRDWFQLSLKEGLTVFRDQEFSADMNSRGVQRIGDVRRLRSAQFPEDAGPLAHPVRPDAYSEINNFYTATVYEKGAELVRMIHTLLGKEGFRRGTDLYFERHDGHAVTIEDFVAAMEEANHYDLSSFRTWYSQAGTPQVKAEGSYDPASRSYTLTLQQSTPATPGQSNKEPVPVPVRMALLNTRGDKAVLDKTGATEKVILLEQASQSWTFEGLPDPVIPSLLRGFSAPVRLDIALDDQARSFLAGVDDDPFNRWESTQELALKSLLEGVENHKKLEVLPAALKQALSATLEQSQMDPAFRAELLTLPSEDYIGEQMPVIAVDAIHQARETLLDTIGAHFHDKWLGLYQGLAGAYERDGASIGRRRLRNMALSYLIHSDHSRHEDMTLHARQQYVQADNMTDRLAAFQLLVQHPKHDAEDILLDFYQKWQDYPLVIDKWFAIQAMAPRPDTLRHVQHLLVHPAFDWKVPNRVRAVLGAFSMNPTLFHAADGSGYAFFAEQIRRLDDINPQTAARLATPLSRWQRYDKVRQQGMMNALQLLAAKTNLSRDLAEVIQRSYPAA